HAVTEPGQKPVQRLADAVFVVDHQHRGRLLLRLGVGHALTYVPSTRPASRANFRGPMTSADPTSITAVPGLTVGHWTDLPRATGDDAYRACVAASTDVPEGTVGAGTGATVGKALGPRRAMKGGVGTWAARRGDIVVGALVVLNSVGDILDGTGAIVAGARGPDGRFSGALEHFAAGGAPFGRANTTLAVVATNAAL